MKTYGREKKYIFFNSVSDNAVHVFERLCPAVGEAKKNPYF